MTDIMPERPDPRAGNTSPPQNPAGNTGSANDPLAHLHKMSTTAGLGTTEYVAINPLAVAAFFLGLASSLALLDNTLLAVPVLALIIAIVALRQIFRSGGTQTGKALAIAGLLLGLLFAGVVGARSIVHEVRTRQDIEQINQLTDSFSQALNQGNADAAYKQFSGRFASMVSFPEFSGRFEQVKKVVKSMKSNRRIDFVIDESTGETVARGMAVTEFPNGADRLEVIYRKEPSGKWTFDKMQFFPEQPQQPPGQAKPAGGAK